MDFVDQFRKSAYVHQYSVDFQRELPATHRGGDRLHRRHLAGTSAWAATTTTASTSTSSTRGSRPSARPCSTRCRTRCSATPPSAPSRDQRTIARGQLLRPYPQFGDILAHQVSDGHAQYHSVVLRLERPIVNGWGGRINYTWSSNQNNVFGELNQFSNNSTSVGRILNSYDFDAEYAHSITEQPHRLNFALTGELPFGKGKKHLSEPGHRPHPLRRLGDHRRGLLPERLPGRPSSRAATPRACSAACSGRTSPAPARRPTGSTESHYDPSCSCINNWFNTAAWTTAPAFTFGNAPRTETRHAHALQDPDGRGLPEDGADRRDQGRSCSGSRSSTSSTTRSSTGRT